MTHEEKLADIRRNLERARELARRYAVVSREPKHGQNTSDAALHGNAK